MDNLIFSTEDNNTAFLKGAILGYCQSHEPEEVAELFNDAFNYLPICKSTDIAAYITKKMLIVWTNKEDDINE